MSIRRSAIIALAAFFGLGQALHSAIVSTAMYLGGRADDRGQGVAVDAAGNAYIFGSTFSPDFPIAITMRPNVVGTLPFGSFLVKLSPAGQVRWTVSLTESPSFQTVDIATDRDGNAYLLGTSAGFTQVVKFDAARGRRVYTATIADPDTRRNSCLPIPDTTACLVRSVAIAVSASGDAYVAALGSVKPGGPVTIFVTRLSADGSPVFRRIVDGGTYSLENRWPEIEPRDIAVDADGNIYIVGLTRSHAFPATSRALQPELGPGTCEVRFSPGSTVSYPCHDAFVVKLDGRGNVMYATYLGGRRFDEAWAVAADADGSAYVSGLTYSPDFPLVRAAQATCVSRGACADLFVAKLNARGTRLEYSTFLGGSGDDEFPFIRVTPGGYAYLAGVTTSRDFPIMRPVQPAFGGQTDAFVTVLDAAGRIEASTYLGSTGSDYALDLDISRFPPPLQPLNGEGRIVHVVGYTNSPQWDLARRSGRPFAGTNDLFYAQIPAR